GPRALGRDGVRLDGLGVVHADDATLAVELEFLLDLLVRRLGAEEASVLGTKVVGERGVVEDAVVETRSRQALARGGVGRNGSCVGGAPRASLRRAAGQWGSACTSRSFAITRSRRSSGADSSAHALCTATVSVRATVASFWHSGQLSMCSRISVCAVSQQS